MLVYKEIVVTGKVQGVFFRGSTLKEAERLGVKGEVKNLPDGSVEIKAEGKEEAVNALVAWCHTGPPHAEVKNVQVKEGIVKGYKNFRLIRF